MSRRLWLPILLLMPMAGGMGFQHRSEAGRQRSLTCPAFINVSESALPSPPFTSSVSEETRTLLTASVFNKEANQEFELKPDKEISIREKAILLWNLDDYRTTPLYLRCAYRDTPVTLTVQIGPGLHHCTAELYLDAKNRISGTSTVLCR